MDEIVQLCICSLIGMKGGKHLPNQSLCKGQQQQQNTGASILKTSVCHLECYSHAAKWTCNIYNKYYTQHTINCQAVPSYAKTNTGKHLPISIQIVDNQFSCCRKAGLQWKVKMRVFLTVPATMWNQPVQSSLAIYCSLNRHSAQSDSEVERRKLMANIFSGKRRAGMRRSQGHERSEPLTNRCASDKTGGQLNICRTSTTVERVASLCRIIMWQSRLTEETRQTRKVNTFVTAAPGQVQKRNAPPLVFKCWRTEDSLKTVHIIDPCLKL